MDTNLNQSTVTSHSSNGPGGTLSPGTPDDVLLQKVQALLAGDRTDFRNSLMKEMLMGVLKIHESDVDLLDVKILNRTIKELRHAFHVFQPYQDCPKVSIFGSARTPREDPNFQLAFRFGRLLSEKGFMVITGAGEGIMWAGHEGAGKENSFGVNIMLPFEQAPNVVIADDPKLVHLKYFFTRKLLFVRESHATALFPGGFGTLDEAFEVLTLIQTGKTNPAPVVCLQAPGSGYWDRWLDFLKRELLPRKLISEADLHLFKIFDNEWDGVEEIQRFYRNYHSIRFINDRLVIRIRQRLTPEEIEDANEEFRDLIVDGVMTQQGAFPEEEQNEPDLSSLTRLVFHYNRRHAGRLRQLIDWLNTIAGQATPVPPTRFRP